MITVAEINDIEQLDQYRFTWTGLLAKTPRASFTHSLEWLEAYWELFGQRQRLRALIVAVGGKVIGIMPLVVKSAASRLGPVRLLTYPLDGWGSTYGPIGPNPAATLTIAVRHLRNTPRDWDLLDLRYIENGSPNMRRTENALRGNRLPYLRRHWSDVNAVDFSDGWESFCASRSAEFPQQYRSATEALQSRGTVESVCFRPAGSSYEDADSRWDLFQAAAQCWQRQPAFGSDSPLGRLLKATHPAAVKAGMVDLQLLTLNGRPIASAYSYHYNGIVDGVQLGTAPGAPAEAGTVLLGQLVQSALRQRDYRYVIGNAPESLTAAWSNHYEETLRYSHFAMWDLVAQCLRVKQHLNRWFAADAQLPKADHLAPHFPTQLPQRESEPPAESRPRLTVVG